MSDFTPPGNLEEAVADLLRDKMKEFAAWAAQHWQMTPQEARARTEPVAHPDDYAKGWTDCSATIMDAVLLWAEGPGY